MTTVVLFHHAQGQTSGFLAFADRLREAGHTVHAPDLFDGNTFASLEEGIAYATAVGFEEILRRGEVSAEELPRDVVNSGFSLGGAPAQALTQVRSGARGAILYHTCLPPSEFGGPWPRGVPAQLHFMVDDPWAGEDLPVAQALAEAVEGVDLFLYPGSGHLFADESLDDYDAPAATMLMDRTLRFLDRVG